MVMGVYIVGKEFLQGTGPYYLDHPEIIQLNKAILAVFKPRHTVAFFTTCSWSKPYSCSYIHRSIRKGLFEENLLDRMDYIHISSAGIIPAEMELWATSYDWNNEWVQDRYTFALLQKRIAERLSVFLDTFSYKYLLFYIRPESNTFKGVKMVVDGSGLRWWSVFPYISSHEKAALDRFCLSSLREDPDDMLAMPSAISKACSHIKEII